LVEDLMQLLHEFFADQSGLLRMALTHGSRDLLLKKC
jgi:hypothetical protein